MSARNGAFMSFGDSNARRAWETQGFAKRRRASPEKAREQSLARFGGEVAHDIHRGEVTGLGRDAKVLQQALHRGSAEESGPPTRASGRECRNQSLSLESGNVSWKASRNESFAVFTKFRNKRRTSQTRLTWRGEGAAWR